MSLIAAQPDASPAPTAQTLSVMVFFLALACSAPPTSSGSAGSGGVAPSGGVAGNGGGGAGGVAPPSGMGGTAGGFMPVETPPTSPCESVAVEPRIIEVEVEVQVPYEVVVEKPTALYFMLDRSGSMAQTGQWGTAGPTKWQNAVDALNAFVGDSGSAGLQVALQYFAIDGVDYGVPVLLPGPACTTGSPHDVPAVAMALLPDNGASFSGSLQTTLPNGAGTPIEAALRGVTKYCAAFQTQNPEWQCVSVLISDGQPSHCSLDVNVLAGIAGTAHANDGVTTFAVAMDGADFNIMNAIATQGQGDCDGNAPGFQACNVTASQTAFLDALRRIRETISVQTRTEMRTELQPQPLECEWGIPPPPEGEEFDKEKVNVKFTQGATEQAIGKVPGEADCANYNGGWYYDDPEMPTRIKACPNTCTTLQSISGARIDILLGCQSEPAMLL